MTAPGWIALNRFGLGATPGDAPPTHPQPYLVAQLARFDPKPALIAAVPLTNDTLVRLLHQRDAIRDAKNNPDAKVAAEKSRGQFLRRAYTQQSLARVQTALVSPTPFAERLTAFWANHFAVSADKDETRGIVGNLEFEAIRPNLNRSFINMWAAVMTHPAMLLYLDQAQSIGPHSLAADATAGRGKPLGLNENLAREAMELHSMGVRSGYSQADVTELARALTGFSVEGLGRGLPPRLKGGVDGAPGKFIYRPAFHEPGTRTVLGKQYRDNEARQPLAILVDLAARPETATHIATKLARHFIADDPPPAAVQRIAAAFQRSGGDLPTVHRALVECPEAWVPAPGRFKSPWDWTISAMRGLGMAERMAALSVAPSPVAPAPGATPNAPPPPSPIERMIGTFAELGQPIWRPGSPAGWSDVDAAWAGPDALLRRVEVAQRLVAFASPTLDARALAPQLLGTLHPATERMLAAADSPRQALALMLAAPEFQRR